MYSPFTCRQKFNRVTENNEEESIENVKDEIENVLYGSKLYSIDYDGQMGPKGMGIQKYQLIESSNILYNIARKLWHQAEDSLELDGTNAPLNDTRSYILDLLNFTRITIQSNHYAAPLIKHNLRIFKNPITHVTELEPESILKLIAGTSRHAENPISQYFHMYLDCLWLLLTLGEIEVSFMIQQLAYYNLKTYERNRNFATCKCIKTVWLRLQLFCEQKNLNFWEEFNTALECYDEEFLINYIPFITRLQCFDADGIYTGPKNLRVSENLDFLNVKWSSFTKNTTQDLLKHLKTIEPLLCDLWLDNVKLDFLYTTWDYFYKKLEDIELEIDFPVLLERINNNNVGDCGYLLFLRILSVQLRKHRGFWSKFRGRIYTRFSPAKFVKLNDKGVFNLMLLMVVASEVSFDEITGKILDLLQAFSNDRKSSIVVWKIYFILMELYIQADKTIEPITSKLTPLFYETSLNRSQFHLLSLLPKEMDRLTSITKNLKLKQETLFSQWMENYTKACTHSDLLNFLNVLIMVVERIVESSVWYIYEKSLIQFLIPSLKRLALNGVEMVGSLAGMIASNSSDLQQIAQYFTSENIPTVVISAFFSSVSRNVDLPSEYDAVILKAWFQCALIGEANSDFTKYALSVNMVKNLNLTPSGTKFEDFLEKLCLSNNKECLKACFEGLEKWLSKHLSANNDAKTDLIYYHMGLIFNSCACALYSRSNASCPLSKFIDLLLLPTEVLRGIRPSNAVVKSMQKNWHLFLNPIFEMSSSDPYLERIAKDIVVRYIPLFDEQACPLKPIIENSELTTFVLTKMNNDFFLQGSTRNEHTVKALAIIKNLLEQIPNIRYPKELVGLILPGIYEVYMFKNQKLPAIDVLKVIVQSEVYVRGDLQSVFRKSLVDVTKKHLPFNTNSYFQMMYVLARIIGNEIRLVLGEVKEEIRVVEGKRGQGFDNNLRISYDKLIKMLE